MEKSACFSNKIVIFRDKSCIIMRIINKRRLCLYLFQDVLLLALVLVVLFLLFVTINFVALTFVNLNFNVSPRLTFSRLTWEWLQTDIYVFVFLCVNFR